MQTKRVHFLQKQVTMLTKFAVKNYRGFKDRIEWDLSNPGNYSFNQEAVKDGVIKNGIIYGPNGGGKSNLSLAIFDIILHTTQKMKNPHQLDTVVNVFCPKDLVSFEYSFRFGKDTIDYSYSKGIDGIRQETLTLNDTLVFKLNNGNLYVYSSDFPMTEDVKHRLETSSNKVSVLAYIWSVYPLSSTHPLM